MASSRRDILRAAAAIGGSTLERDLNPDRFQRSQWTTSGRTRRELSDARLDADVRPESDSADIHGVLAPATE